MIKSKNGNVKSYFIVKQQYRYHFMIRTQLFHLMNNETISMTIMHATVYIFKQKIQNTMGYFISILICLTNNKAFCNLFCNPQNSFHIFPGSSDSSDRGCQSFFIMQQWYLQKILQVAVKLSLNAIVEFEEWLAAPIIRVGKFRRGVKTLCG